MIPLSCPKCNHGVELSKEKIESMKNNKLIKCDHCDEKFDYLDGLDLLKTDHPFIQYSLISNYVEMGARARRLGLFPPEG